MGLLVPIYGTVGWLKDDEELSFSVFCQIYFHPSPWQKSTQIDSHYFKVSSKFQAVIGLFCRNQSLFHIIKIIFAFMFLPGGSHVFIHV
tara:strand:- start:298 stop:564 length:267 start_codon:yes stop_codon:yes gene_type:complete